MPIYEYKCRKCKEVSEVFQHCKLESILCKYCNGKAFPIMSRSNFNAVELKSHRIFGHGDDGIIH